ncbi:hypothetical protein POM88_046792 [Heracleum sosnowskyi]|uniref:VWA-Hint protein Vwaint domain-containing protein n=1 Tax=Heracleum sosnowskyi TaxID=360622 RepID=A0AAD8H9C3_9APIA|nr:hypothetical protein POM88_046792 [Heracleum sosnowskyi]
MDNDMVNVGGKDKNVIVNSTHDSINTGEVRLRLGLLALVDEGYRRNFYLAQGIVTVGLTKVEIAAGKAGTIELMRAMWRFSQGKLLALAGPVERTLKEQVRVGTAETRDNRHRGITGSRGSGRGGRSRNRVEAGAGAGRSNADFRCGSPELRIVGGTAVNVSFKRGRRFARNLGMQTLVISKRVAVQGFILNIAPVKGYTTIEKVNAGDYETTELGDSTVNVTFGVLYQKETRRVMVDLVLSEVPKHVSRPVVSVQGKARVIRTPNFKGLEKDEVIIEESRLETAEMMKEARIMADNNDLNGAKNKIIDAQSMLDDMDLQGTVKMLEMLKQELDQFMAYLQSPELYKKHGRAFALSSELSHARQRFATRGDMDKLRLFSTPRMDAYQQQAKSFDKDPTKSVPIVEEDQALIKL